MIRLLVILAAVAALGAACADDKPESSPGTVSRPDSAPAETQPQESSPTTTAEIGPALAKVRVTVLDGDTGRRVRGARVRVGRVAGRTDAKGRARLELEKRKRIRIEVKVPRYSPYNVRTRLGEGRFLVRLYRPAVQWPTFGANPARTQVHPAIKLRPPFRSVWARGVGSLIEFPAVVWEGVAYVGNIRGYVTALSMRNGKVLWRKRVGTLMAASPGLAPDRNELVIVTMSPGHATVLDMRTGRIKWRTYTGRAEPSPVVRDGIAYFAAANGNVYALDLARRKMRWVYSGGVKITSSPALRGNRLYFGDYAGRVFALNARNGRRIWTGSAGSRVYGTVAVAGGRVFAPSVFSGLSALSARSGRLLWRIPVGAYLYSAPAVYRNRVYFGTYGGFVYCADARSGRILWSRPSGGRVSGAVQVVAGVVYAGSLEARITAWDWRTGRTLWTFPHGQYVPVSGNGGRLLMHGSSKIWAVEPKRKKR